MLRLAAGRHGRLLANLGAATGLSEVAMREGDDKVVGAKAIAFEMGCSIRTVYRRAEEPDAPIYKPCGRYYAFRAELRAWARRKPDCQVLAGFGR